MDENEARRVVPLGDLPGFRVAEGYPDVRGWEVDGTDGVTVGWVAELLVDVPARKARYMLVKLFSTLPAMTGERTVVVPIGQARLDATADRVCLDEVDATAVVHLPEYHPATFTEEHEDRLFQPAGAGEGFYEGPAYDHERFYGARRTSVEERSIEQETVAMGFEAESEPPLVEADEKENEPV